MNDVAPPLPIFPLAEGIAARIADATTDLIRGGQGIFVTHTTTVTSELLRFWFQADYCEIREANFHEGQRDAILSIIYAHEVLGVTNLADLYSEVASSAMLNSEVLSEVTDARNKHPKYAAKMATGTGKTWVLNALLVWQHLNAIANPTDTRFTSNFLIVAPGLIVYERLLDSFQGKTVDGARDFETSDIYSVKQLFVPENYRQALFGFIQSSVVTKREIGTKVTGSGIIAITNWHLLSGDEDPDFFEEGEADDIVDFGSVIDEKAMVSGILPLTPGVAAGNSLDVLDRRHRRGQALNFLRDLPSLVVFNDEAHHIHALKKGEEVSEVEWQKSLRIIAAPKAHQFIQFDFSATPYNEIGTRKGEKLKKYFPHIVVDFDLRSAMSQGLVKTLVVDRRREIAALPLDFKVERDDAGNVQLSNGQKVMLRAGLERLNILRSEFSTVNPGKHPKMMVVCEDTTVVPLVESFLLSEGLKEADVLSVHSGKKAELGTKDWEPVREKLFSLDRHEAPRVVISVLMLREGFDVNNICVIVPLRASQASILLEQTIGRGLRLMWRGDAAINDAKAENRKRIAEKREPLSYFDMLFIVEHPAFQEFYDELIEGGGGLVVDETDTSSVRGDVETIRLRDGWDAFDFEIPIVLRDAEEEMRAPVIDPLSLSRSKYDLEFLKRAVGHGDQFTGVAVENKLQFGDYRVHGGVMTATGFNDFLSRLANRIVQAHQRAFVANPRQFKQVTEYPILQAYRPLIIRWLDTYIRNRYFGAQFDPLADENWRVLLVEGVAEEIAGVFGTILVELQENVPVGGAEVMYRYISEVDSITVRTTSCVSVTKSMFEKLPYPSVGGGLERDFMEWADNDGAIEAFIKLHEYRHDSMRRPYLKADGMPALYSPDFLVRVEGKMFLVETKAQSALSDANVQRKRKSAVSWVSTINSLPEDQRDGRSWFYVLAGETALRNYMNNGGSLSGFLSTAALLDNSLQESGRLF
ncbi:type III restriction enzyme [Microbacteriaceae bacterium MWH-Ta3]|nr:type III restriction enzyme [Microbacteriaceae bacterium MWH-Ta3]